MHHTTLVVPCYNEETRLQVGEFQRFAAAHSQIRFVMVDDGSQDQTADILAGLVAARPRQFEAVSLAVNSGKAEAVRQGMVHALDSGADSVGFVDADLATPLGEVLRLIDVLERRPDVSVVVGSRLSLAGHAIQRRLIRRLLGRCFAAVASSLIGLPLRDTQCGLKLFRTTDVARRMFADPFRSRWIFDVELLARLIVAEGREAAIAQIYEMPLEKWSEVAGSKLKSGDFVKAVGELLGIYGTYIRGGWSGSHAGEAGARRTSRRAA
jgi:glycosyltransferase involved in cell wall biosynthesis